MTDAYLRATEWLQDPSTQSGLPAPPDAFSAYLWTVPRTTAEDAWLRSGGGVDITAAPPVEVATTPPAVAWSTVAASIALASSPSPSSIAWGSLTPALALSVSTTAPSKAWTTVAATTDPATTQSSGGARRRHRAARRRRRRR